MQGPLPAPGAVVWIRQTRWHVAHARREDDIVRLDVASRGRRMTFLVPFDRPSAAIRRDRARHVRPQRALARLADVIASSERERDLTAVVGANLDILPHQLEPLLAMRAGARRVLVADEVGLGKTVQAGLILAELERRQPAMRSLVVVPASLRAQWIDELGDRFGIECRAADAGTMERRSRLLTRGENPWRRPGVWIASLDYLKQPHVFDAMAIDPWDVLVIDEAHAVCGASDRHEAAAELARRSRRVVLLTATPHSGDELKFTHLVDLGRLPCRRDELIVFRRTRIDVALTSERRVRWRHVAPTDREKRLLDALTAFEHAVLAAASEARRPGAVLLLSVFRKRALSTTAALMKSLERRLVWLDATENATTPDWLQPSFSFDDDSDDLGLNDRAALSADIGLDADRERSWLRRLRLLAEAAARDESKVGFLTLLLTRSREPVAIFTEFRDSLTLLARRLSRVRRVAEVHGGLTSEEQQRAIGRFLSGGASVLLATDVASQGLNLQTRARWVVNLELPWNPARVEQRAGRVDRIGQRRPVHVTLLVARHSAESGVLARLVRRTLLAQRAFGPDILRATSPDERALDAFVIAGAPPPSVDVPQRAVVLCRSWSRSGRIAAARLKRRRRLTTRWRGPSGVWSGASFSGLRRLPRLKALIGDNALLIFSVPIVDRHGLPLERHLVAIRAARTEPAKLADPALLDAARATARRALEIRARRLQRRRQLEAGTLNERERAIARALLTARCPGALQPGLFDRRAERSADNRLREADDIRRGLADRLRMIADSAFLEVGRPVLELVFSNRR